MNILAYIIILSIALIGIFFLLIFKPLILTPKAELISLLPENARKILDKIECKEYTKFESENRLYFLAKNCKFENIFYKFDYSFKSKKFRIIVCNQNNLTLDCLL